MDQVSARTNQMKEKISVQIISVVKEMLNVLMVANAYGILHNVMSTLDVTMGQMKVRLHVKGTRPGMKVHCADQIQCIDIWEQCDGKPVHCRDGSDDQENIYRRRPCFGMKVHCADQIQCIYNWEQCDSETVHCRDGSDEQEDISTNNDSIVLSQLMFFSLLPPGIVDGDNVPAIMENVFTSISSVTGRMTAEIILMKKNLVLETITDFESLNQLSYNYMYSVNLQNIIDILSSITTYEKRIIKQDLLQECVHTT
ncbi:unnamed protein product [Mytilus coruscus]|uniref:Uncharacterized protein n=1 Tax=Mytilus coruscus TaxID=42192 RepID=A0A6J8EI38_MYTCO|nr:unnamed protein product [Mytilus coruscus]